MYKKMFFSLLLSLFVFSSVNLFCQGDYEAKDLEQIERLECGKNEKTDLSGKYTEEALAAMLKSIERVRFYTDNVSLFHFLESSIRFTQKQEKRLVSFFQELDTKNLQMQEDETLAKTLSQQPYFQQQPLVQMPLVQMPQQQNSLYSVKELVQLADSVTMGNYDLTVLDSHTLDEMFNAVVQAAEQSRNLNLKKLNFLAESINVALECKAVVPSKGFKEKMVDEDDDLNNLPLVNKEIESAIIDKTIVNDPFVIGLPEKNKTDEIIGEIIQDFQNNTVDFFQDNVEEVDTLSSQIFQKRSLDQSLQALLLPTRRAGTPSSKELMINEKKHALIQLKSVHQGTASLKKALGGSTCPLMAVRSGQIIVEFCDGINLRLSLDFLTNVTHALRYGKNIKESVKINNLASDGVRNIAKEAGFAENRITVLDSVSDVDMIIQKYIQGDEEKDGNLSGLLNLDAILDLKEDIQKEKNFVHAFVIGTGEKSRFIQAAITQNKELSSFVSQEEILKAAGGFHWVCVVLVKVNDEFYWFALDSGSGSLLAGSYLQRIEFLIRSLMGDESEELRLNFSSFGIRQTTNIINNAIQKKLRDQEEKKKKEEAAKKKEEAKKEEKEVEITADDGIDAILEVMESNFGQNIILEEAKKKERAQKIEVPEVPQRSFIPPRVNMQQQQKRSIFPTLSTMHTFDRPKNPGPRQTFVSGLSQRTPVIRSRRRRMRRGNGTTTSKRRLRRRRKKKDPKK